MRKTTLITALINFMSQAIKVYAMLICIALFTINCSHSDDASPSQEQTTLQLLIAGKWYQQSISGGSYTSCEKSSYFNFMSGGIISVEMFEENMSICESLGITSGTYSVTNSNELTITVPGETFVVTIDSISETQLVIINGTETITFDRTPN